MNVAKLEPYQFVMAEPPWGGGFITAWFREEKDGKYLVEFADDSNGRWVNEILPLETPIR